MKFLKTTFWLFFLTTTWAHAQNIAVIQPGDTEKDIVRKAAK